MRTSIICSFLAALILPITVIQGVESPLLLRGQLVDVRVEMPRTQDLGETHQGDEGRVLYLLLLDEELAGDPTDLKEKGDLNEVSADCFIVPELMDFLVVSQLKYQHKIFCLYKDEVCLRKAIK